jgi:FtsH-binding integral membrane protein
MEHFHMMKFGGFVIIVSLVLFGAFSQTLAIAISFGWVLIWIIFTLIEQG